MSTMRSVQQHGYSTPGYPPGDDPSPMELVQQTYQLNSTLERIEQQLSRLERKFSPHSDPDQLDDDEYQEEIWRHHSSQQQEVPPASENVARKREPWLWCRGATLPHRSSLKAEGGRWSRKHQSWFFIGKDAIPMTLKDLDGVEWEVTY